VAVVSGPGGQPSSGLLGPASLVYQGAFRLPQLPNPVGATFSYGGTAMAYDASRNGLFMVGHDQTQLAAEVNIPNPVLVPVTTPRGSPLINTLPRAVLIQPFADSWDGKLPSIGAGTPKIGGMFVFGPTLVQTAYLFYDASSVQTKSHVRSGTLLSTPNDVAGPYQVGTVPGFVSGWMAETPAAYVSELGPALTGNCCLSIIGRTSLGPAVSTFDPSQLGVTIPLPSTTLLAYPLSHPTLGNCSSSATLFNCAVLMGGMVFPNNTRSVLFFGRLGSGPACYGDGVSTQPPGMNQCYDPSETAKGYHAFPYAYEVWAYDVLDLIAVKHGTKLMWDVQPYATWTLTLPFTYPANTLKSAAYDPATSRIFLTQQYGDFDAPLVHVFTIQP